MQTIMLKSKIHKVTVTDVNINYEGSITIDKLLLDKAGIRPFEKVGISNMNNGERFETYALPGESGSGMVCINGPAARKAVTGDVIVVFCYAGYNDEELAIHKPVIIKVDTDNNPL